MIYFWLSERTVQITKQWRCEKQNDDAKFVRAGDQPKVQGMYQFVEPKQNSQMDQFQSWYFFMGSDPLGKSADILDANNWLPPETRIQLSFSCAGHGHGLRDTGPCSQTPKSTAVAGSWGSAQDTPVKLKLPSILVLQTAEETAGGREIRQSPNVCLI